MSCVCLSYNGFTFDDPTPLVTLAESYSRRGNEGKFFKETAVTLSGTLWYANEAAPSGTDSNISRIREQQLAIEEAFSVDRETLLIVDASGYEILRAQPVIDSITWNEGTWAQTCDYQIACRFQEELQDEYVSTAGDNWDTTLNPDGTITVNHSVSANGVEGDYTGGNSNSAFINAKNFVLSRINVAPATKQFFIGVSGFTAYNHTKQESANEDEATYGISESWTLHTASYVDDRTTSTSYEIQPNGETNLVININGVVVGLVADDEPEHADRLSAAQTAFTNIIAPAIGFNSANVSSKSTETNSFAGTLSYSLSLSSNPSGTIIGKTTTREFSRNEDGSTTQTVTVSAQIAPLGSGTINDVITWVDANIDDIASTNPPYSTSTGIRISRGSSRDDINKSYSRTDTFIDAGNTSYREEYTVQGSIGGDGVLSVTVAGTIYGLYDETSVTSETRFSNAQSAYAAVSGLAFTRADQVGDAFNRTVINHLEENTLAYNRKAGTVSYSHTYSDKAAPPGGVLFEDIQINDSGGDPIILYTDIPGRSAAGVFDLLNTITAYNRQVNIDWVLDPSFSESEADAAILPVASGYLPSYSTTGGIPNIKVTQSKSYNPKTRRYSRSFNYDYSLSGTSWRLTLPNDN